VEDEALVAGQPFTHLWMLVRRIIVEDHMNGLGNCSKAPAGLSAWTARSRDAKC
jgi:hypothetical protein